MAVLFDPMMAETMREVYGEDPDPDVVGRDPAAGAQVLETLVTKLEQRPAEEIAARLVAGIWRGPMEAHHDLVTDGQMAWMSIASTVQLAPHCRGAVPETDTIVAVLGRADRKVLPGLTLEQLLGDRYDGFVEELTVNADRPVTAAVSVGWANAQGWWAMPGYHERVERFVAAADPERWGDLGQLRATLLREPLSLTPADFDEIVVGNGLGWWGERT